MTPPLWLAIVSPSKRTEKIQVEGPPQAMEQQKELLKGSTESLLLALLAEQPMYGYQLVKELERRSNGYFRLREGTLYPALHRLEQEQLLEGRWQRAPGGQNRRYYFLTEDGQLALATRLTQWDGFSRAVSMVLAPSSS